MALQVQFKLNYFNAILPEVSEKTRHGFDPIECAKQLKDLFHG
jgi:hypothetical protein